MFEIILLCLSVGIGLVLVIACAGIAICGVIWFLGKILKWVDKNER